MADAYSIKILESELSVINFENMDTTTEVKLAAEIGQFLLGRNKALETILEKNQQLITDQQAEIDKLEKQSHYLQNANINNLKISEQLEQSLLELERSNEELLKQRGADQDTLKELKERKDFLEQRCENLEESYEYIEEKLVKAQGKMESKEINYQSAMTAPSASVVVEEAPQEFHQSGEKIVQRLDGLSTGLSETKCEVAMYHQRMEKLEIQLSQLLLKNMELEDVITSRKFTTKSKTCTSGCSSEQLKNRTSLAEEIEAAKFFADGCFITSTPPKVQNESPVNKLDQTFTVDPANSEILSMSTGSIDMNHRQQRNKLRGEASFKRHLIVRVVSPSEARVSPSTQRIRIDVCIEVDPSNEKHRNLCRQRRWSCLARKIALAYKETVIKGICKILGPFISQPRNYIGTLLLWSNKTWIERNIRVM